MENNFFKDYSNLTASIQALEKDEKNPFFKSNYISLSSILKESKRVCLENNFIFIQTPVLKDGREVLITELRHISGEKISCEMPLIRKENDNPQKLGASLTYMRRYSLTSILGIQEADDDGNLATAPAKKYTLKKPAEEVNDEPFVGDEFKTSFGKKTPLSLETFENAGGNCADCGEVIPENVREFSMKFHKKALCYDCQQRLKSK